MPVPKAQPTLLSHFLLVLIMRSPPPSRKNLRSIWICVSNLLKRLSDRPGVRSAQSSKYVDIERRACRNFSSYSQREMTATGPRQGKACGLVEIRLYRELE